MNKTRRSSLILLHFMCRRVERKLGIIGLAVSKEGPCLNHLFFMDDNLLFCKANLFEWHCIQKGFDIYEEASGLKFNKDKISIFFSKNTKAAIKARLMSVTGVSSTRQYEKYLGLLAIIGRLCVSAFSSIKG